MTIITISNGSAHHGYGNKQEKCIAGFKISTWNFHTLKAGNIRTVNQSNLLNNL